MPISTSSAPHPPDTGPAATPGPSCAAAWKPTTPPARHPPIPPTTPATPAPPTPPAAAPCNAGTPNAAGSAALRDVLSARVARRQQRHRGGEAVQERVPADGPDLTGAEHAGERDRAELVGDGAGVVVRLGVHVRAAAVAGEEQRRLRALAVLCVVAQRGPQIGVGAVGVAGVEAKRLPHPH